MDGSPELRVRRDKLSSRLDRGDVLSSGARSRSDSPQGVLRRQSRSGRREEIDNRWRRLNPRSAGRTRTDPAGRGRHLPDPPHANPFPLTPHVGDLAGCDRVPGAAPAAHSLIAVDMAARPDGTPRGCLDESVALGDRPGAYPRGALSTPDLLPQRPPDLGRPDDRGRPRQYPAGTDAQGGTRIRRTSPPRDQPVAGRPGRTPGPGTQDGVLAERGAETDAH